jgi:hypothetical protein
VLLVRRGTLAALAVCAVVVAPAQAETSALAQAGTSAPAQAETSVPAQPRTWATLTPSFSPDRLGARGAVTFTIRYEGGTSEVPWYAGGKRGVPSPVRKLVVRFPAGMGPDIPNVRSCVLARLRAHGARGCPAASRLGGGHALTEIHAGSQTLTENVALRAFVGPVRKGQPTLEILGEGYTPFGERLVFTGRLLFDRAPYGEELVMSIPPIPTLPLEPDASMVSLSLTLGESGHGRRRGANTVIVPRSCPPGGFPFAAESTYADGSSGSATATAPCP